MADLRDDWLKTTWWYRKKNHPCTMGGRVEYTNNRGDRDIAMPLGRPKGCQRRLPRPGQGRLPYTDGRVAQARRQAQQRV